MIRAILIAWSLAVSVAAQNAPSSAPPPAAPAQSAPQAAPNPTADTSGGFAPPTLAQEASETPQSQTPAKTFKTSTRLVVLDVVVTDKQGAPVHDLKREDFQVFEGGREQQLKVFEERRSSGPLDIPAPQISSTAPNTSQATNAGQEHATSALSVILFDALNTASADQSFARSQVKKVIAQLPAGSRIAIFVLRNDLHMMQGFTTNTAALARAMDKDKSSLSGPWFNDPDMVLMSQGPDPAAGMGGGLSPGAGTAAGLGTVLSGNASPSGMGPTTYLGSVTQRDEEGLTSELRTRKTLAALSAMARYLSVLPGRKNLLWLSGTFPFDLLPDTSGAPTPDPFRGTATYGGVMHDLAQQMEAGHIAVYPVDVRGVSDNGIFNAAGHGAPSLATISAATGAQLSQQAVMENIAHETGGRAIYNDNDVRGEIIESLNQGGNFYTLAYSPEDKNWNGKYRKIEVRTVERGVHLYYRHGYLADDPATNKRVAPDSVPKFGVAMLHGAPERAEVVMTVEATGTGSYVEAKDRKPALQDRNAIFQAHLSGTTEMYKISCKIDANTVVFQKSAGGTYTPHLALTFLAYDADGKVLNADTGLFNHPLSEAQYTAVLARGLTVTQQMEVPLGRCYLRIGVHDLQDDKVGATELPVVVTRKAQAVASPK